VGYVLDWLLSFCSTAAVYGWSARMEDKALPPNSNHQMSLLYE
jgi:hypothetical protein